MLFSVWNWQIFLTIKQFNCFHILLFEETKRDTTCQHLSHPSPLTRFKRWGVLWRFDSGLMSPCSFEIASEICRGTCLTLLCHSRMSYWLRECRTARRQTRDTARPRDMEEGLSPVWICFYQTCNCRLLFEEMFYMCIFLSPSSSSVSFSPQKLWNSLTTWAVANWKFAFYFHKTNKTRLFSNFQFSNVTWVHSQSFRVHKKQIHNKESLKVGS